MDVRDVRELTERRFANNARPRIPSGAAPSAPPLPEPLSPKPKNMGKIALGPPDERFRSRASFSLSVLLTSSSRMNLHIIAESRSKFLMRKKGQTVSL